ncbi:MAG: serine esterase [Bdellovibrio sp. ArHS]|uniref:alpha/beta hydrolase n=1 Tax=Bdellovibrio sp. ArHS TaxID=1569284 RepID=UPI0005835B6C|nr:serine esterase [Bdellovibrio sp. ArHS]KHD89201.1 MAG: serine esterase [Bdellovibrio sp. ArHS]
MRQLGKIHCQEINNDDNAPWVIFFHGFGADCNDLFSLGDMISTKKTYNWLFPNGILEVPIGPAWMGRAWWTVNMLEIQEAQARGEHRDFSNETPKGLPKAYDAAMEMIRQLKVPWNKIVLGGFSQGAMLATEIYLRAPETPAGLVIMSGTLLHQEEWKKLIPARQGQRFFQSHGEMDQVLGHKQAQKLNTLLNQNGMKGSMLSFRGGHEIPAPVIMKIGEYLNSIQAD